MLDSVETRIETALEDDAERGVFRVARDIFTDPELFELEMKTIFEGNWIYLAHESQVANPNDFFTTTIGRQPIIIARNRQGELNAFINACSHRGAMLCRFKRGNKATYTCPFHGWTFNNSGKLLKVKDPEAAGYPQSFDCDGSHNLTKVARFESYRGFLFGSLNADVAPLAELPRRGGEDHRPDGRPVARGPRGRCAARPPTSTTATGSCRPRTAPTATTSPRRTGTTPPPPRAARSRRRATPSAP